MAGVKDKNKLTIKQRFDDVCKELNMDEATAVSAWENYERIDRNYTLEASCVAQLFIRGEIEANIRMYIFVNVIECSCNFIVILREMSK